MTQLQHRGGNYGKIVLKHHPLDGLIQALSPIEGLDSIQTIIPGVITSVRGRPIGTRERGGLQLKVQYIAPDGHIRLLARQGNTTQEIRIICTDPDHTFTKIRQYLSSD